MRLRPPVVLSCLYVGLLHASVTSSEPSEGAVNPKPTLANVAYLA